MSQIQIVEMELSVTPLYEDQPLFADMLARMTERGFHLVDLEPIGRDNLTGHHPQFDGIFVRRS